MRFKKCMRFKKGDCVIVNPNITDGTKGKGFHFYDHMRVPGIIRIEEVRKDYYICSNDYSYTEDWLLPVPMFNVGDKVRIVDEFPPNMRFGVADEMYDHLSADMTISEVKTGNYGPSAVGEDGCLYRIKEDGGKFSWPSTAFIINNSKTINNEDQLQERRIAVSRGDKHTGSSICCRGCKTTITVGHLSHKKVSGI